ncbi:hypothetical protein TNCT_517391 [Trichonephila clavata]|uniref:Uncharacterized protein n=1 Tax=Trichonephila clavata TaxID=2740835 RepID=A0A8X6ISI3_TRICU|nr:hypothetical protein TNCT_517391 [Trichonephila clavata]
MTSIKILFWNAGGFTYDKFTELKFIAFNQNFDLLGIVERHASTENLDLYRINGYQTFCLHDRLLLSLVSLCTSDSFIANMTIRHTMTVSDRLKAVEINAWRGDLH